MKIKKYYCRHCGQFRSERQVYDKNAGVYYTVHRINCKYCDREVIETEQKFKKFLDEMREEE